MFLDQMNVAESTKRKQSYLNLSYTFIIFFWSNIYIHIISGLFFILKVYMLQKNLKNIEGLYHFRLLRKITTMHLLSTQRLNAMEPLRTKKVEELMSFINKCCEREEAVDIARAFFVTALNIISNALFSTDFATHDSKSSHEYHNTVISLMNVTGKPNVGDYFPFLRFLDLQGTRKEATLRLFKVFQDFINARMAKRSSQTERKDVSSFDMLDTLLDLTQENKAELSLNDIKHFLQVRLDNLIL